MATVARARLALIASRERPATSLWSNAWYRLQRDQLTIAAAGLLLLLVGLSVTAPFLAEYVFRTTSERQDLLRTYAAPTLDPPGYLLGGDEVGRSPVVR